jgi:hypothetical protein
MTDSQNEAPAVFDPAEVQAVHRRLLAAKELGIDPRPEDVEMNERIMASPYWQFDRPWAPDDY